MKKVLSVLAALAAVGASVYLLYRKFGKPSMVVSGEFEDDETIVLEDDATVEPEPEEVAEDEAEK